MDSILARALLGALLAMPLCGKAAPGEHTVVVSAPNRDYRDAPISVVLDAPTEIPRADSSDWMPLVKRNGQTVPSDARRVGKKMEVAWLVPELKHGQKETYRVSFHTTTGLDAPPSNVRVEEKDRNLEIRIKDQLFTRYDTTTGPNKPYFYPLYAPDNRLVVRHYPLEKVAGETADHPHHRGMWFTHGAVNGEDYWSEGGRTAKTVHSKYEDIRSGQVRGYFRAATDWINREGAKVAEDVREVNVYNLAEGRLMDFTLTLKAVGGPLVLGDTKEGSFGLRLADSMRVAGGDGHIETSTGLKDGAAWGKRAEWVDYYGTVDGETVGVAILDNPKNLRHPTYWHVRDYGLFAVNPFGLHDFEKGQPGGAGNYTIPAGGTLTFRYRLLFHKGATADARIADLWAAYSDPPKVEIH
jgi:hypothetical protein